jgi:hypothetical protein
MRMHFFASVSYHIYLHHYTWTCFSLAQKYQTRLKILARDKQSESHLFSEWWNSKRFLISTFLRLVDLDLDLVGHFWTQNDSWLDFVHWRLCKMTKLVPTLVEIFNSHLWLKTNNFRSSKFQFFTALFHMKMHLFAPVQYHRYSHHYTWSSSLPTKISD